jgi:hypothetical protein
VLFRKTIEKSNVRKVIYAVMTPQAWIKETEKKLLSDSEELTLPAGLPPIPPKVWPKPWALSTPYIFRAAPQDICLASLQ